MRLYKNNIFEKNYFLGLHEIQYDALFTYFYFKRETKLTF